MFCQCQGEGVWFIVRSSIELQHAILISITLGLYLSNLTVANCHLTIFFEKNKISVQSFFTTKQVTYTLECTNVIFLLIYVYPYLCPFLTWSVEIISLLIRSLFGYYGKRVRIIIEYILNQCRLFFFLSYISILNNITSTVILTSYLISLTYKR